MTANIESLVIPKGLIMTGQRFSMEYGVSAIKIVYRSKQGVSEDKLCLTCFESCEVQEAISFIKDHVDIEIDGGMTPVVHVTGTGCHQYQTEMNEKLNIRMKVEPEFECFLSGFLFALNHIPRGNLVYKFNDNIFEATIAEENAKNATVAASTGLLTADTKIEDRLRVLMDKKGLANPTMPLGEEEDIYPCLLCIVGSALVFFKVQKDGSYSMVDLVFRGGQSAYDLATLLTGCRTYREFMELAEKGTNTGVNTYVHDVTKINDQANSENEKPTTEENLGQQTDHDEEKEGFYANFDEQDVNWLMFFFGKAVNSQQGQFSREDIARGILLYFANECAQLTQLAAKMNGCKHVFFCGSFLNSSLARELIASEIIRRFMFVPNHCKEDLHDFSFDFLVPGPHLGAIGALLKGKHEDIEFQ